MQKWRKRAAGVALAPVAFASLAGCVGLRGDGPGGGVRVERVDFRGWTNAWQLSNAACELVVVPQVSRVMSFALRGGANLLWVAPEANGQVYETDDRQWHNLGGDKVWPAPQDLWLKYTGRNRWPPPHAFDSGRGDAEPIPNGLRLRTPRDPDFGAVCIREFTLDARRPLVRVRQRYEKDAGGPVEMSVWGIMQVRGPTLALLPPGAGGRAARYETFEGPGAGRLRLRDSVLSLESDSAVSQKVGVPPDARRSQGWVAGVMPRDGAMLVLSHRLEEDAYPDRGCHAEVFTSGAGSSPYTELELLSPLRTLRAGDRLDHDVVWQIVSLGTDDAADPVRAAVRAREAHRHAVGVLRR